MRKLAVPDDEDGWEKLAVSLLKANLALARMTQRDLHHALRKLGIHHSESAISTKLTRGTFPASFFLQSLVAMGVEEIALPEWEPVRRDQADGGSSTI